MAVPLRNSAVSARRTPKPAEHRPALTLSPAPRRRWPAVLGSFALLAVLAGMLGAAVFHTQLAERQIRIGVLERSVNDERERFDELRHRRAAQAETAAVSGTWRRAAPVASAVVRCGNGQVCLPDEPD